MSPPTASSPPFTLDLGTGLSLLLAFSFMPAAQLLASSILPRTIPPKRYWIFIWCAYDFLTHSIIEGSYLYHCFFSYINLPAPTADFPHPASLGPSPRHQPPFLGRADRLYGSFYSDAPFARLWQEYAKADRRWGGADTTIISLELLTVLLAGPAAAYICYLIAKIAHSTESTSKAVLESRLWFIVTVLSTAELYGGFITFGPEWLSGNTGLAGDDPVYLWLYLVFFNMIWVFVPLWVLYEAYHELSLAFLRAASSSTSLSSSQLNKKSR